MNFIYPTHSGVTILIWNGKKDPEFQNVRLDQKYNSYINYLPIISEHNIFKLQELKYFSGIVSHAISNFDKMWFKKIGDLFSALSYHDGENLWAIAK